MLLSRFWYVVLALCLGAAVFILFVAQAAFNRRGERQMAEALSADSSAVGWYLQNDARRRASALVGLSLDREISEPLAKVTEQEKPENELREKVRLALNKGSKEIPEDLAFTALWIVDAQGRVIANVGYDHTDSWELGGYSVVADALHGWIRDDTWIWQERMYRVVARPILKSAGQAPIGAVVGARVIDDSFAGNVSRRTGAAVGFYVAGQRVASHAPEGFAKSNLDLITKDLQYLDDHAPYQEKGRSEVRVLGEHLGVVYARIPGEAWPLGAGYAVGRLAVSVKSPLGFLEEADQSETDAVPTVYIGIAVFLLAAAGLLFSYFEHTRPIVVFKREAMRLAKGEIDILQPSRFRGSYKKIASDLNDGIEVVAAKGGAPRRAADLEEVLGPIPAQPAMSAFAVPGGGDDGAPSAPAGPATPAAPSSPKKPLPKPKPKPPMPRAPGKPAPPSGPDSADAAPESVQPVSVDPAPMSAPGDELGEWRRVFEEFVNTKKQCGESVASLTFEKFKGTLERNKKALVERHNCTQVRFTVYVKDGKAALKASPVR